MVSKVGSAGHVIDSVIQYTQNSQNFRSQEASDKRETKTVKEIEKPVNSAAPKIAEALPKSSEKKAEINAAKKPDNADENRDTQQLAQNAAVFEDSRGEIIENRDDLELREEAVKITVDDVNKRIHPAGARVEFSYHEKTKRYSFKVLDTESGETIREFPPQKSLDMVAKMFEMVGLIVDEKL